MYEINEHGIIQSPGKLEGEMEYIPELWGDGLEGLADKDVNGYYLFGRESKWVVLWSDSQGLVHSEHLDTKPDLDNEQDWPSMIEEC